MTAFLTGSGLCSGGRLKAPIPSSEYAFDFVWRRLE